ncbi:hypothetical protein L479_02419 [Exiguobacterium sp. S17]|nr:hypothetical protein L479_02419 [Exiguobacterium sp. S17]
MKNVHYGWLIALGLVSLCVWAALGYAGYRFLTEGDTIDGVPKGELVYESVSPDGTKTIFFYRTSGGATTGFAMLREIEHEGSTEHERIFWDYPCEEVTVVWKEGLVTINDVTFDPARKVYDFRYGIYAQSSTE